MLANPRPRGNPRWRRRAGRGATKQSRVSAWPCGAISGREFDLFNGLRCDSRTVEPADGHGPAPGRGRAPSRSDQEKPSRSKENQRNPRKNGLGFPWISLDSLVRIETFQWVMEQRAKFFFPRARLSKAPRTNGWAALKKRSVHMSNSGSLHHSAITGRRLENCSLGTIFSR